MRYWLLIFACLGTGCDDAVLGNNLLFVADNEQGDWSVWQSQGSAAVYQDDGTVELSTERAHSGRYSARIVAEAAGRELGAGLMREFPGEGELFVAAWYYIPQEVRTLTPWIIMRMQTGGGMDAGTIPGSFELRLRSRSDGELVLEVFQGSRRYLLAPLPEPPPIVPVKEWFHLEFYLKSAEDDSGALLVWLNGELVYALDGRGTDAGRGISFSPCSVIAEAEPNPVELFVDDVAVSSTRITPDGVLGPLPP